MAQLPASVDDDFDTVFRSYNGCHNDLAGSRYR